MESSPYVEVRADGQVPPYMFPLLILSKRLHSIFVLRCFNDCFAVFFLWLAIFFFQRRSWALGGLAYTLGLGIKMTLLLVLPAVVLILFLGRGLSGTIRVAWLMAQVQFVIAVPFLMTNSGGYLSRAFELSRQFKFEWTVNWRMMGEDVFLSKSFSRTLLGAHIALLLVFIVARWLRPANRSLMGLIIPLLCLRSPFSEHQERWVSNRVDAQYVMTAMLTANVIGLLCARSLHYQFYAYLAWASPYLLWRACPTPSLAFLVWGLQEAAWNVFPSTHGSSAMVVNMLLLTVGLVYFATSKDGEVEREGVEKKKVR